MACRQPKVYFQRIHPRAQTPKRMTKGSAGYDMYAISDITIQPKENKLLPTGLVLELPGDHYAQIADRSSMAMKGLKTEAGIIDSDYRGEVKVLIRNHTLYHPHWRQNCPDDHTPI